MNHFQVRTDLALEAGEKSKGTDLHLQGVQVEEYYKENIDVKITKVVVGTKNAASAMGKDMGEYITIEAPTLLEWDEDYHKEISQCLSEELIKMLGKELRAKLEENSLNCLVVGLGNRDVTADSLGPRVLDNLNITRHLVKEYGKSAYGRQTNSISALEPGVMAKTGMETAEIVKGVVHEITPDVILVVDALAARSTRRLHRTIQISDTGIQPGSGVGNHRNALTRESLQVPVIAIGIPTVVDAVTIVGDAWQQITKQEGNKAYGFETKQLPPELCNMYLTGKDIDAVIKQISFTVSEGINVALARNI